MNAVCADDQLCFDQAPIGKCKCGAGSTLLDRHQLFAKVDAVGGRQGSERRMKARPVDHQIRSAVALLERLTHNQNVGDPCRVPLSAVESCRRETLAAQRFDQPEPPERLHGVGGELNASADWSELCRLLIDLDLE